MAAAKEVLAERQPSECLFLNLNHKGHDGHIGCFNTVGLSSPGSALGAAAVDRLKPAFW